MSGASATGGSGKRVGYYEHVATKKKESTINYKLLDHRPRRIPASKIEPAVWEEVKKFVLTDDFSRNLLSRAKATQGINEKESKSKELETKIETLERQIALLAERIATLPEETNLKPLFEKLSELQKSQNKFIEALKQLQSKDCEESQLISFESVELFRTGLRELITKGENDLEMRSKIIKLVVHKIEILKMVLKYISMWVKLTTTRR
jgi:hypothetical protein